TRLIATRREPRCRGDGGSKPRTVEERAQGRFERALQLRRPPTPFGRASVLAQYTDAARSVDARRFRHVARTRAPTLSDNRRAGELLRSRWVSRVRAPK